MASIWGELKRRNVVKVAVAYAVVGWLLIEIAATILPLFEAPDWIAQVFAFFVILGFPLALVLSWAYELTPEGMKRSHEVPAAESITQATGRKIDFAIIGALVLALGFMVYSYVLEDTSGESSEVAAVESEPDVLPNSVAVLPLENLSPDPDNAFFAAGIHEEILNHLAKLRNLNVISRTSVVRYADSDLSVPEIAAELNVGAVMEGSVRYADDRVLVTMQLIDPATDVHLWSESYNRDLADVFAIQADIAMNVANSLEAEFSLAEQESIEKIPTASPEAYTVYLRAFSASDGESYRSALSQAIALDPNFAVAYAARAAQDTFQLVGVGIGSAPDEAVELERRIFEDAERALSIDTTLGAAHAALAAVHQANWRGTEAEQAFQRAVELSPNDLDVLLLYARFKRVRGDYEEAIRLFRRVIELNPHNAQLPYQLGLTFRDAKQWDAAAAAMRESLNETPAHVGINTNLGWVEAARGNTAESVRRLQLAEQVAGSSSIAVFRLAQMARAYAFAGRPEDARRVFSQFEERAVQEGVGDSWWAHAYIAVGEYEQALERVQSAIRERVSVDQTALVNLAANPWGDTELEQPEFQELFSELWDDG